METKREHVGRVVSKYFRSHGLDQKTVASRLGVKRQSVANQLQKDLFSIEVALKYANEFGLNYVFLLSGRGRIANESMSSLRSKIRELRQIIESQEEEIKRLKGA